jgi:hypothetical protein
MLITDLPMIWGPKSQLVCSEVTTIVSMNNFVVNMVRTVKKNKKYL